MLGNISHLGHRQTVLEEVGAGQAGLDWRPEQQSFLKYFLKIEIFSSPTLLELLLVGEVGGVSELLVFLGRRGLLLSVSHTRIVEVMQGGVDMTNMTSSPAHQLRLLSSTLRTPRRSEHHLRLDVSQGLHAGHRSGRGEGRLPGLLLLLLLELRRGELRLVGRRQLGERHDGGVLVLDGAGVYPASVGQALRELRLQSCVGNTRLELSDSGETDLTWVRQVEVSPLTWSEG